jgi:SulP family sulfate permease
MSPDKNKKAGGFRFDRMELAGSVGDLGTLVPLAAGMIVLNGLSPTSVLLWVGLFYLLAGFYYRLPIPVQPLKVVAATVIAYPALYPEPVIAAAGLIFGGLLLVMSLSGALDFISGLFTRPVIRGIQLGLGLVLMIKGVGLIASRELFVPAAAKTAGSGSFLNPALGVVVFLIILFLLNNKRLPAALAALAVGIVAGLAFGGLSGARLSLGPAEVRLALPAAGDFLTAFVALVIPQIPLTIGNACFGTADTARSLFPQSPDIDKAKASRFALTMGIINVPAGLMAAMPMCHGAGGLAAHYRFGARTGGSNLMIGAVFVFLALALGKISLDLLTVVPNSVLGALLAFAGIELALLVRDMEKKSEMFVAVLIAGIAASGVYMAMAWAFSAGIVADLIIKRAGIEV